MFKKELELTPPQMPFKYTKEQAIEIYNYVKKNKKAREILEDLDYDRHHDTALEKAIDKLSEEEFYEFIDSVAVNANYLEEADGYSDYESIALALGELEPKLKEKYIRSYQ